MADVIVAGPVQNAVIIAPEYFFLRENAPQEDFSPVFILLGVPLIVRVLRQLQDAGVQRSTIILPERLSAAETIVKNDFRITHQAEFRFVPSAPSAQTTIQKVLSEQNAACYVCRSDLLVPAMMLKTLASIHVAHPSVSIAIQNTVPAADEMGLIEAPSPARCAIGKGNRLTGVLILSPDAANYSGTLSSRLEQLAQKGEIHTVRTDEFWSQTCRNQADLKPSQKKLLRALRKPIDGFIARSINRNISIPISRLLANTPITPNQSSSFSVVLAIMAIACVVQGGYYWMLAGAFLFQCASIVDGVDGELARLKYKFSKYGEWFDTVADDISNFSFFAGVTYAISQGTAGPAWLLPFGISTLCCYLCITPLMYSYIILYTNSGDVMAIDFSFNKVNSLKDDSFFIRMMAFFKFIAKRDFFIFSVFVFALFDILPYFLIITSVFSFFIVVATAFQHIKKRIELRSVKTP